MNWRRCFCCLLVCVLLCSVVFSNSVYADEVDFSVDSFYYYTDRDTSSDGEWFNTTISLDHTQDPLYIDFYVSVENNPFIKNKVYDLSFYINMPDGDFTATLNFYDAQYRLIDTYSVLSEAWYLNLNDVQFTSDVHFIDILVAVDNPRYEEFIIHKDYNFTVNGTSYTCLEGMTWADFIESPNNDGTIYSDDGGVVCSTISNGYVYTQLGELVYEDYPIMDNTAYWLTTDGTIYDPVKTFTFYYYSGGIAYWTDTFQYEEGMTWNEWLNSSYSSSLFALDGNKISVKQNESHITPVYVASSSSSYVLADETILQSVYGTYNYWTATATATSAEVQYIYNATLQKVDVYEQTDEEVSGGILAWIKNIFKTITNLPAKIGESLKAFFDNVVVAVTELPNKIASAIKGFFDSLEAKITALGNFLIDGIKGLFVPSEESLLEYKTKWETLLADRFGAVYESAEIIDDWANAFMNTPAAIPEGGQGTISVPSVSVNLAGTDFTFGGWNVKLVPDGFSGLIDTLKLIINIVCTILFVNGLRKRLESVLA